ncbi:SseB family protein [Streptomyces meridianus]|uniref:SseB family protein n=1 Tax=Streptomyces meridianus TaxID=2938945 RepID=A0ABT0X489_9ACTN|nr:SseB family protein [Streptomyces meridianus]MCM2577055.1 SseB family protein [Streptomyces meridianus]
MLKNIPDPGFSDDDGSADASLAAALTAYGDDRSAGPQVLAALPGARLLVPVVAVLGEAETGPDGLRREKSSDMAVPTLRGPGGRRALPAFTSAATLARWDPQARPVAVPLQQALRAAAHENADTIVLDIAGPVTFQLSGPALTALAEGRTSAAPVADPAVVEAVRAVVAAEPGVRGAALVAGNGADGTLALTPMPDVPPRETMQRVAAALAADEVLRGRLVRGLDLALLPEDTPLPGNALFVRRA